MIEMISANAGQTEMTAGETPSCLGREAAINRCLCPFCRPGNGRCYEDAYLSLRELSRADKMVAGRYCNKWKQAGFGRFGAVSPDCSRSLGTAAGLQRIPTGLQFASCLWVRGYWN